LKSEEIEGTTFRIYLFLVKEAKPLGPRDVMRGIDLSSPSVAYRHLQKLENLGLIQKNNYGQYVVSEKQAFKGYVWVGRNLLPRLLFYSFFFLGLCIVGLTTAALRIIAREEVQLELMFFIFATGASTILFMIEGIVLLRRLKEKNTLP
jgi:predicted transcriptional regulator